MAGAGTSPFVVRHKVCSQEGIRRADAEVVDRFFLSSIRVRRTVADCTLPSFHEALSAGLKLSGRDKALRPAAQRDGLTSFSASPDRFRWQAERTGVEDLINPC